MGQVTLMLAAAADWTDTGCGMRIGRRGDFNPQRETATLHNLPKRRIITDRIGEGGNTIVSVRPSVRLFQLYLRNRLTVDLERLHVSRP